MIDNKLDSNDAIAAAHLSHSKTGDSTAPVQQQSKGVKRIESNEGSLPGGEAEIEPSLWITQRPGPSKIGYGDRKKENRSFPTMYWCSSR